MSIANLSPEERAEYLEQAQKARAEKIAYYKTLNLRQDWGDENYWRELASEFGVKLPAWYIPATDYKFTKFIKKLGYKKTELENETGHSVAYDVENNPNVPAWVVCGWILEDVQTLKGVD